MWNSKLVYLLFIGVLFIEGCSIAKVETAKGSVFQVVKNDSSYESFWAPGENEQFIMNLAINHSSNLPVQKEDFTSIKLLPSTDMVKVEGFNISPYPPQRDLEQKGFFVYLSTQGTGKHTFHKIVFHTKDGKEKELDIGNLTINVHDGIYSGIQPSSESGIFSQSRPLIINAQNGNDYPVKITEIRMNNPHVAVADNDTKVILNGKGQPFSRDGYVLKPNEQLPIRIDWKVTFPFNQTLNIDLRPVIISEYKGKTEYAGVPNVIFRNDFSERSNPK
ncbi:hypothetical protein J2Z48_001991 [Croceifilum oryzae]|uniref:Uncharacterized protein n=1 Tax=Croceifilum oryzae TaxID=1553429 RepID=A0AAJ1WQR0_9BACL|nr:hypothetical protein [Croceifilum oryzae]MDQ0417807.1 hypothetical protein [Croceifilum oryzae]